MRNQTAWRGQARAHTAFQGRPPAADAHQDGPARAPLCPRGRNAPPRSGPARPAAQLPHGAPSPRRAEGAVRPCAPEGRARAEAGLAGLPGRGSSSPRRPGRSGDGPGRGTIAGSRAGTRGGVGERGRARPTPGGTAGRKSRAGAWRAARDRRTAAPPPPPRALTRPQPRQHGRPDRAGRDPEQGQR